LDWGRSKITIRDRGALEKLVESGRTDGDVVEMAG